MNQRFQNEEIKRVSEQYAENELYKAVSSIGPQLENELKEFGLCSEECFMETLEFLSSIAEKGKAILSELDEIWLRKENEYRRYDRHVNGDEIRKSIGIVFGFAILAVDSSQDWFYRHTLSEQLTTVVANHKWDGWSKTLALIFSLSLPDGWFDAFVDEEPANERIPLPKTINTERAQTYFQKAVDKGYMKFNNGQFVWIGVKKKPNGTPNISELAYFLGKVYEYKHSVSGNIGKRFPEDELNSLFGKTKLYNRLVQVHNAMSIQAWRQPIDDLFQE